MPKLPEDIVKRETTHWRKTKELIEFVIRLGDHHKKYHHLLTESVKRLTNKALQLKEEMKQISLEHHLKYAKLLDDGITNAPKGQAFLGIYQGEPQYMNLRLTNEDIDWLIKVIIDGSMDVFEFMPRYNKSKMLVDTLRYMKHEKKGGE